MDGIAVVAMATAGARRETGAKGVTGGKLADGWIAGAAAT